MGWRGADPSERQSEMTFPKQRYMVLVDSEVYVAGKTEDGHPYIAERYFVLAEDMPGNRWSHEKTFAAVRIERGEECDSFINVRAAALAAAERLCAKIDRHLAAGGDLDFKYWRATEPAYGSDAYMEKCNADGVEF